MRILALALVMVATPAMAADQFDLVCTAKKETVRYRVDLATGEWCLEDCRGVNRIAEVTTGTLTLVDDKPLRRDEAEHLIRISRTTGEWYTLYQNPSFMPVADITKGTCEPAEFSGFPKVKF